MHEVAADSVAMEAQLQTILQTVASNGPQAMRAAKRLCLELPSGTPDETVMNNTARQIARIRNSQEAREGVSAFLEKRQARWKI